MSQTTPSRTPIVIAIAVLCSLARGEEPVEFNRHIRPILSNYCYPCHGPDGAARQADLRLDLRDEAIAPREGGHRAITPGDPENSLLLQRVASDRDNDRMPPPETKKRLNDEQVALLRRWIQQGARWQPHWAFVAPEPAPRPTVSDPTWPANGIDHFILATLDRRGLTPTSQADRTTLIRRLSFDLTGLPPTPGEIDAFLADTRPNAYERLVDRLLASPRYGERMAMDWLDAARYADTHGYHYDNERTMWRWRDWVIDAFNDNLPFDQFTIEQLAGDLLPEPALDQLIATGFNRNHGITWEGGIIPQEYQAEYVIDRVHTTSTVWMGLSMGCARCHDHKFDPISQREFYQFAAFFNTISEKGSDGLSGNADPLIPTPAPDQTARLTALTDRLERTEEAYEAPDPSLDAELQAWSAATTQRVQGQWHVLQPFSAVATGGTTLTPQDDGSLWAEGAHPPQQFYEIVAFTHVHPIVGLRIEAMGDERLPDGGPGRASHANFVLSECSVSAAPLTDPGAAKPVELVSAVADFSQRRFNVSQIIDGRDETGWAVQGSESGRTRTAVVVPGAPFGHEGGTAIRIRVGFQSNYTQHSIGRLRLSVCGQADLVEALQPSRFAPWHVAGPFFADSGPRAYATAFAPETQVDLRDTADDGTPLWRERPQLTDAAIHSLTGENAATYLYRTIDVPTPRTLTLGLGSDDAIKVWVDENLILESDAPRGAAPDQHLVPIPLTAGEHRILLKVVNYSGEYAFFFDVRGDHGLEPPLPVASICATPKAERTDAQRRALRDHFLAERSPMHRELLATLRQLRAELEELEATIPTTMIMREMDEPRETHVLGRGRYDQPGELVTPGVPAVLPTLSQDQSPSRLALAHWLTDPSHPLTARVAVNRIWQQHFGTGLVETAEDFGVQGEAPSHPELLDWLAIWFVEHDWNVKALQRLIVTSATYRQNSSVDEQRLRVDPNNRLLSRGPRVRLSAEMIRDSALASSGLLVERIGGPPVKPYQPEGLWKEVGSDFESFSANAYMPDQGEGLYRRSLYTFWKRTMPPPAMLLFDAPSREYCVVRRSRTNTPLQALVLMNDPTYVEAARALAERVLAEAGPSPAARLTLAFRFTTGRRPTPKELALVTDFHRGAQSAFENDRAAAKELLQVGERPVSDEIDGASLAALTMVSSMLLNLDAAITRE